MVQSYWLFISYCVFRLFNFCLYYLTPKAVKQNREHHTLYAVGDKFGFEPPGDPPITPSPAMMVLKIAK